MLKLSLLKHQHAFVKNFLDDSHFWAEAIVSGFGAGKTYTLSATGVVCLLQNPGFNIGVYSATFDLLKLINIPSITNILNSLGIAWQINKTDMIIYTHYGNFIFRSMDNPGRIIGYEHSHALVDELDTMGTKPAEEAWNKIIARNRQKLPNKQRNKIGVGTTPEGFKFVYKKWKKEPPPGYRMIKACTQDNPYLPEDYVQNLIDSYPENLIKAYLDGEFVNLTGNAVYHAFDRFVNYAPESQVIQLLTSGNYLDEVA